MVTTLLSWGSRSATSWPTLDLAYRAAAGLTAAGYSTTIERREVSL